ncbi:hypothetical protein [Hymenobacter aranciens]|uniref:hypothetical protein n=1 Tax=Hymenobacter aranciens TaxID=3063996 RepID=UPI00272A7F51|nr:hypothetical protein [Hymenobacter sp. ASUV-10]
MTQKYAVGFPLPVQRQTSASQPDTSASGPAKLPPPDSLRPNLPDSSRHLWVKRQLTRKKYGWLEKKYGSLRKKSFQKMESLF